MLSCCRTYEPSSKLNLKVLQDILKGIFKIQKDEELAKERDEEEEQAAQNISYLLADDMELDFDDDDVPAPYALLAPFPPPLLLCPPSCCQSAPSTAH